MTILGYALLIAAFCVFLAEGKGSAAAIPDTTPSWDAVQRRAFDFFWDETNPVTGLTKDRSQNIGAISKTNTVASIAATGYALASLPIGVSHKWITRPAGYRRALTTLRFFADKIPSQHGFYYHFVDTRTGARVWNSEVSSIDTALLLLGAQAVGRYWPGTEVQKLAEVLMDRADWTWIQNGDVSKPEDSTPPSMGWKPKTGFLSARWQGYSEAFFLYCLALGSRAHPLAPAAWANWQVSVESLEGYSPVFGGASPLFMAQMAPGYIDVRGLRDGQGRDWWAAWQNAHLMDQAYCARNPEGRKSYTDGFWGINANDRPLPLGYGVNRPANGQNDGTVSPTAMLAAVMFTPDAAEKARHNMWQTYGSQLWGRYGFSNAFNAGKNWCDADVIGIDLGMMLIAIENARTGLIWRLMRADPAIERGLATAGFTAHDPNAAGNRRRAGAARPQPPLPNKKNPAR